MLVPTCNQRLLLCSGSIEDRSKFCCESVPDALRRRLGPSRKPDSALSRHPSPGEDSRAPPVGAAPTSLGATPPRTIWLARTGGLPGRSLRPAVAGLGMPPVGSYPTLSPITCDRQRSSDPSAGLLSVALDVTTGLRPPSLGLLARAAFRESGLFSTPRGLPAERSDGSDGPNPPGLYLTGRGGPWSGRHGRRRGGSARSWWA